MNKYLNIEGSEQVIDLYGGWPCFREAEIITVLLDRRKEKGATGPTITIKVHCFTTTDERDEKGNYKTTDHAQITLQFYDVVDLVLTYGFGTQNSLAGVFIEDIWPHKLDGIRYSVEFGANQTCDLEFKCGSISITSFELGIPEDSTYA